MSTKAKILLLGYIAATLLSESAMAQTYSLPSFESYPVAERFAGEAAPVDINSSPKARLFRAQLESEAAKSCVNFAGHYSVVTLECGVNCKKIAVIDAYSGRVYLVPFEVTTVSDFRADSRLFIANASEVNRYIFRGEEMPDAYKPRWYLWEGGRFTRIFQRQADSLRAQNKSASKVPSEDGGGSSSSFFVRKTEKELLALATYRVEPVYTSLARAAKVCGDVFVEVTISEKGDVISAQAVAGHPLLQLAAANAARGWKFKPDRQNGAGKYIVGLLRFRFQPST